MKKAGLVIVIGIILIFALLIGAQYNSLVKAELDTDVKWAEVTNQMKRRADLVPDLVKAANKVMAHEKDLIDSVTEARAKLAGATSAADEINASNELDSAISKLLVVMEAYPQMKSDETYIRLMDEMAGTENRLATARKNYNDSIGKYSLKLKAIPTSWFAKAFGFEAKTYYEVPATDMEKPNYDI